MEPAGEMWSVVTESPKMPSDAGAAIAGDRARLHPKPSKKGGSAM